MEKQPSAYNYFPLLDGIRGAAALLVVLRHTTHYFGGLAFQQSYLAVDIFFVLSGFVLANAYEQKLTSNLNIVKFFEMRLIRLFPLYWLSLIISIFTLFWVKDGSRQLGMQEIILGFLLLPNIASPLPFILNSPAWSLFFELLINVIYGATVRHLSIRLLLLVMLVSGCGLTLVLALEPSHSLDAGYSTDTLYAGLFRVTFSFFAGLLIFKLHTLNDRVRIVGTNALLLATAVLSLLILILVSSPSKIIQPYFDFFSVVFVFPTVIYLSLQISPSRIMVRLFTFLGAISYALYVIHVPLANLVDVVIKNQLALPASAFAPWLGIAFVTGVTSLCWLMDKSYDGPVRAAITRGRRAKAANGIATNAIG